LRGIGKKISGVESCGVWEAKVGLVLELREEIVNVLVRGTKSVEGENLENKTGGLEGSKKRQVSLFFVLESSEKSSNGVDGR
jgi:hypothetical protein